MDSILCPSEFIGLIGVARADISPPVGIYSRNWGSSRHAVAAGIHRPLTATALALGSCEKTGMIVVASLDLSFWRSGVEERGIRDAILRSCGLTESQLILHQSHTHSAPSTAMELVDRPGGALIPAYRDLVIARCSDAIRQAIQLMEPAVLTWSAGSCRLGYDRHFVPSPGLPVMIGLNPSVAADDTVLVGRVVASTGRMLATIVNYACHPVSLGGANELISPDYVGAARETIEQGTDDAICMFLQGASGDITPRRSYERDVVVADQNGRELGYSALAVLHAMLPPKHRLRFVGAEESGTTLAIWRTMEVAEPSCTVFRQLQLSTRLEVAELPSREELRAAILDSTDRAMRERNERRLMLRETVGDGTDFDFRFEIVQLGQSFVVAIPAEPYSVLQLTLRSRFLGHQIAVLNIANGYFSYLPPECEYSRDVYQVRVALFRAGSLERVIEAASAGIEKMLDRTGQPAYQQRKR